MPELPRHLEESIRCRGLFRRGQGILVAVSGGVDSMVLLEVLHQLAPGQGWRLTVGHLNHGLRGRSSEADERLVRRTAARLKLPVVIERADVRQHACAQGLSLEMAAREVRHEFLARTAARLGIRSVALAQHADDQIELFFLRLLRGSGGEGLAGMKWRSRSPSDRRIGLVRPLLDQPKEALRKWAAAAGIRHREDASNRSVEFQRNRIRYELLPLLRRKYQPALDRIIMRVMEIVGAEAEFAAEAAEGWLREGKKSKVGSAASEAGGVSGRRLLRGPPSERDARKKRAAFNELPVAVQRRCVQLQLVGQGIMPEYELVERLRLAPGRPVGVGQVQDGGVDKGGRAGERHAPRQAADAEFEGEAGPPGTAAGGLRVVREESGRVRWEVAEAAEFKSGCARVELQGRAGEVEFGGARVRWLISARKGRGGLKGGKGLECFDADRVGRRIVLRHWQPGDRFQPIGMRRPVKLQDFFTNQKVPREQRRGLVVAATARGEVFWVEGARISERFKLRGETKRRLQWRWKRV